MTQFSLTWDSYKSNICQGLSSLQQSEEFVDMTLAADGHYVKVHQMVMSLASPYLRELIKSAPCQHPVLFLNKVSYPILCCILEYVYSGEVHVDKNNLNELLEAGKALHIKGLDDMANMRHQSNYTKEPTDFKVKVTHQGSLVDRLQKYKSKPKGEDSLENIASVIECTSNDKPMLDEDMADPFTDIGGDDEDLDNGDGYTGTRTECDEILQSSRTIPEGSDSATKTVQYTLSNQGSLQMVLNRFVYYLRYCHKNSKPPIRLWRCVDYIRNRCPASVTTKDDIVVQRVAAHKHPFHDKKIMKKMQDGIVFTAIKDAEAQGKIKKQNQTEDVNKSKKE